MYINEIKPGSAIKLIVLIGAEKLEFDTQAINVDERNLGFFARKNRHTYTSPLRIDGKILSLPVTAGVQYSMQSYNPDDEKMYEWKNLTLQLITTKEGQKVMVLFSQENAKSINRRKHFRIWLGCSCVVQFGLSGKSVEAIMRDLSSCGMGLVFKTSDLEDVYQGMLIRVSFFDSETKSNFGLNGLIVRILDIEDGKSVVGCKLTAENPLITKFINEKQRIQLKKHSSLFN